MPDTDPNDFTDREKFILSYYRSRTLSGSRRILGYDIMIALASIGCVVFAMINENLALGLVGYVLLLGRQYHLITEGERWTRDFQNIFSKYDAKLKALTETSRKDGKDDAA
jgi:hypothetical protein